jgi:hypothetical protein
MIFEGARILVITGGEVERVVAHILFAVVLSAQIAVVARSVVETAPLHRRA